MQNFTYVVQDNDTSEAVVVDPSWDLDRVMDIITRNGLHVPYIINTHHHFDHTVGNQALADMLKGVKIIQHGDSGLPHDITVSDGDVIEFGRSKFSVYHTPGHSKDSICLYGQDKLLSGDTLFVGSCGRVDLPGGSATELHDSLFGTLCKFADNVSVFPGHDYGTTPSSTIGIEKRTNPVLQIKNRDDFVQAMG